MSQETPRTVHLGRFDPLEAPIVLDLLHEHGIFALSNAAADQAEGSVTDDAAHGRIFVDAAKLDEARRLIEEELPDRIEQMSRSLDEGYAAQEEIGDQPLNPQ
ncbi:MAG: hypothetical protein ABR548_08845 [Actinomycetota bacterium]|nr:DUF2007 domain-containing protein [Actinomycetota bacterium]